MNTFPQGTEKQVCDDIARRQEMGVAKYGTTVANNPLELREWLQHAYEETLDKAIYLKRAIEETDKIIAAVPGYSLEEGVKIVEAHAGKDFVRLGKSWEIIMNIEPQKPGALLITADPMKPDSSAIKARGSNLFILMRDDQC